MLAFLLFCVLLRKDNLVMTTIAPFVSSPSATLSATPAASADTALRLVCKQQDFARGLAMVSRAVLSQSTRPILSCILLATDQGRLRISATNLEIGIQVWVDAQIEGEGMTVLPADLLTRMVSLMPKETMTLSCAHGSPTLKMACSGSVSHIRSAQDPREFPVIPSIEGEAAASRVIDAGLLKQMIEQVAFAADVSDPRPILTAVFTQIGADTLTFAAAGPYRLAERIASLPGAGKPLSPILIPARNLAELARVLPGSGEVTIAVTPQRNQVVFHCEEGERIDFASRLLAGNYISYEKGIPKTCTTHAVIETRQFAAAIERAALFANDVHHTARVTLRPPGESVPSGTITVEAEDADMGDHLSAVRAEVTGPERQIIFPVRILSEALAHIETPQVALSVDDPGKPAVLKPVSEVQYTSVVLTGLHQKKSGTA
jgi:DNA polymerase-3 subunit beta